MKTTTTMLMVIIILTSVSLSAQTSIGLTGGVAFANVTAKAEGVSISLKHRTGFTAGLFMNAPLSKNFYFQPALNFVQKGYDQKEGDASSKLSYNYLELPLNFVYSVKQNEGLFIGAGPAISFGLSGKAKVTDPSGSASEKIKFGSGDEEVKRSEFGADVLAGYRFAGGFLISANYYLGLSNIQNGNANDIGTIKNKYFAFKIGYVFGDSKKKK
jgi:hypothetical protein